MTMQCTIERAGEKYDLTLDLGTTLVVTDNQKNRATVQYVNGQYVAYGPASSVVGRSLDDAVTQAVRLLTQHRERMSDAQAYEAMVTYMEKCANG